MFQETPENITFVSTKIYYYKVVVFITGRCTVNNFPMFLTSFRVPEKPFCDCSQWWLFCGGNYSLSEVQKCSQTQDWRPCCKKKKSPFQNTCQQIEVRLRLTSLSPLSLLVSVFPRKISRNSMQLIRQQSLSRDP